MIPNLGRYGKSVTALVTGGIGWATQVVNSPPTHVTAGEWVGLATVVAVAFGVYAVSNDPEDVDDVSVTDDVLPVRKPRQARPPGGS